MTNLRTKKELAAKALKVGKGRIVLSSEAVEEIKQAITKQDIKDLVREGIISVKPIKGRKKVQKRSRRRGPGKIKKTVNKRKQIYVKITRKLRKYLMELRDKGIVERDLYQDLRKKIRMRTFKSKAGFRDYLKGVKVEVDGVGVRKKVEKVKATTPKSNDAKGNLKKDRGVKKVSTGKVKSKNKVEEKGK